MCRALRVKLGEAVYHVLNRANEEEASEGLRKNTQ
jgi:hypothetical protein